MSGSILDYLSNKDGLLDSKGALSSQLPSRAIALAKKEVASVLQQNGNSINRQRSSCLQAVILFVRFVWQYNLTCLHIPP